MVVLHACIFAAYDVLEDLVGVWAEKCDRLLVTQHPADGKTQRVHCHFLIETKLADDNPFRESGKKILKDFFKRGNYWIASKVQKGEHAGKPLAVNELMDYCLKGKFYANFHKNFSKEEMDNSRSKWVDSVKNDTDQEKSTSGLIERIVKSFNDTDFYYDYKYTKSPIDIAKLFEMVRTRTFKQLYRERRMVPHASHYKIVAGSVLMRICENLDRESEAISVLQEKWY